MSVNPAFQRFALLAGAETAEALHNTRVAVVGLGGVGSWCAEALVRSGTGRITLIDFDTVQESNINRQAEATAATLGRAKTEALAERLREINPGIDLACFSENFSGEKAGKFGLDSCDYIIDAIDSIGDKLDLIEYRAGLKAGFFSSMGMAWKFDATKIQTASVWKTSGCPLARRVRQGLRKRNFSGDFTVVFSPECQNAPDGSSVDEDSPDTKKRINGSLVTVTATAGMILAGLVIQDICRKIGKQKSGGGNSDPGGERNG